MNDLSRRKRIQNRGNETLAPVPFKAIPFAETRRKLAEYLRRKGDSGGWLRRRAAKGGTP